MAACHDEGGARCGNLGRCGAMWRGTLARVREDQAQGTLEYALTVLALLAIVLALGELWRAGERGTLAALVERAASHLLSGTGALDIALY